MFAATQAFLWWPGGLWAARLKLWSWSQVILLGETVGELLGPVPLGLALLIWLATLLIWLAIYMLVAAALFSLVEVALALRGGETIWRRAWASWSAVHVVYWLCVLALELSGVVEFY